jgi:hypothetical protein
LGFGLTYGLDGILYLGVDGANNGELWSVDPATGAGVFYGPLTYVGNDLIDPFVPLVGRIVSMTTHPGSGLIFALLNDGVGGAGPTFLITIDPPTLVAKLIGQTDSGLDGLAFLPPF